MHLLLSSHFEQSLEALFAVQHGLVQSSPQAAFLPLGQVAALSGQLCFSQLLLSQSALSVHAAGSHGLLLSQSRVWVDVQATMSDESAITLKSAIFFIGTAPYVSGVSVSLVFISCEH